MKHYERAICRPNLNATKKNIIKQYLISDQKEKLTETFDLSLDHLYALSTAIHIFWKYLEENGRASLSDSEKVDIRLAINTIPEVEGILSKCLDFDSLEELCCKSFSLTQKKGSL